MSKDKVKDRRGLLLRLWRYLSRYQWMLVLGSALMLFSNLLSLIGPKLSGKAIDAIGTTKGQVDFEKLHLIAYDSSLKVYREVASVVGQAFHDGLQIKK